MATENNIRVEMFRVEGDAAPFVQVNYVDKDAQVHTGLFLLDSGSNENILSPEIVESMGSLCSIVDGTKAIASFSQEVMQAKQVRFSFILGNIQFDETFCVKSEPLDISIKGMTVIGILGHIFLQQQRLVIDYRDFTLHTSEITPKNFSTSDCDFFFPMVAGLKIYGVPVVPIIQNGAELVTLVDTGATNNVIANQALMDHEFKCEHLNSTDVMKGISGQVDVHDAKVWFSMLSLYGDDVVELSCCSLFKVLPHNIFTLPDEVRDKDGDPYPPINVLLGAPFMASQGWILDFGAKIIYKRKVAS